MTDYNFLDKPDADSQTHQRHPVDDNLLTPADKILIEAGQALQVRSLSTGVCDPILQHAAQSHAAYQAACNELSHRDWYRRRQNLCQQLPGFADFRELCAGVVGFQVEEAASAIFHAWSRSADHWVGINGPCSIWGYAFVKNAESGAWYATAILGYRYLKGLEPRSTPR